MTPHRVVLLGVPSGYLIGTIGDWPGPEDGAWELDYPAAMVIAEAPVPVQTGPLTGQQGIGFLTQPTLTPLPMVKLRVRFDRVWCAEELTSAVPSSYAPTAQMLGAYRALVARDALKATIHAG